MAVSLNVRGTLRELSMELTKLAFEHPADAGAYELTVRAPKKRRSLNANSYYWQLLAQYAAWAGVSNIRMHNDMLSHYGQVAKLDGILLTAVLPDTDSYRDFEKFHLKPTSRVITGSNGEALRVFIVLEGSSSYTPQEMARLIDGLISEIKGANAPIETMTPAELAALKGYMK